MNQAQMGKLQIVANNPIFAATSQIDHSKADGLIGQDC